MATIKTFSQIVQSSQDNIRLRQPALDTKPGTVARDVFIDNLADQVAVVYRDMQLIQKTQSLLSATGQILDQFGSNYGITRDPGKRASGTAVLTFSSLLSNINIASGTTVTAKTGAVFRITANIIISAATKGIYASYASSIASQLHIAGISDPFALQVPVEAVNVGNNGNIPAYSLIKTSIPGISNVTNISPTVGGTNPQGDPQYRNQILAGLSGSSAGTARGYKNALLTVSGVQSTYIASPGNPILTRDGTVTNRNSDGSLTVLTPGTGGKVDIWLQGNNFVNISESYVFHDVSGTGDVTSAYNAHILGQTTDTADLTPSERRQLYTQNGTLPLQPADSVISLTGSVSGANFVQGVNYELVQDTNPETRNTAFALDNITFLQDYISLSGENVAKGVSNSVDALVFNGIKEVTEIRQNIIVSSDLAALDVADHTKIIVPHNPVSTVLRATNLTTGERYIITDQNIDSETGLNEDGAVFVDGSVLPSAQDLIQVDYTWSLEYDSNVDYFGPGNVNFTTTGIDWGRSNYIEFEEASLIRNGNRYNLGVTRDVDRVYAAFYCDTETTTVQEAALIDQTGATKALRQVTLSTNITNVVSVKSQVTGLELYTTEVGGTFSGTVIYLAVDVTQPEVDEEVLVYFNSHEIFNIAKNNGTVSETNVVLSTDDVLDFNSVLTPLNDIYNDPGSKPIFVDYVVADVDIVTRTALSVMPFIGSSATSTLVDKNSAVLTSRQPVEFGDESQIIRSGPAYLSLVLDGAFSSGGTVTVKGTGWFKIITSIPVSQSNVAGLFDLSSEIISSIGVISNNYSVVKMTSASIYDGLTTQQLMLRGYEIHNNTYDVSIAVESQDVAATSIDLSGIFEQNGIEILTIGSTLNITFYVLAPNAAETVQFTNGRGTLYTKYKYTRVDRVDLISGFTGLSGYLKLGRVSQPATSTTYLTDYSYYGPVENERITVQYRYNNIIQDATNAVEDVRTLTADVLTRLAIQIVVNVSMTVILSNQAINQQAQILDQALSAVNNLIVNTPMGTLLDYSSLLRVVTAISGVTGADVTVFDYVGSDYNGTANRKSIQADANQYFFPGTLSITPGTR